MKVSAPLPTGVAALLGESARKRRKLEDKLVAHLEARDFSEVILPVVDYLEPYEAMLDTESRQELYRFVDRDGEMLALRADFTPMLARLIAPGLASLKLPLHLFYRGDVLRYQEDQAGRQREFYQLGAEFLGLPAREGESQMLRRFLELISHGERRRMLVVLGFAGALDELLLQASDQPSELTHALLRRDRRVARAAGAALLQVVENGVPDDLQALGSRAAEQLQQAQSLCDELQRLFPQIDLRLDLAEFADQTVHPDLHHRLGTRPYYDGLVFRAFGGRAAEPVGAGGRYDRLFERLGAPVTACGFSLSLDRLLDRGEIGTGETL